MSQRIKHIRFLSPLQKGMLFSYLKNPKSSAYFEQLQFTLTGAFDSTIFQKSFQELINRHDALRSIFVQEQVKEPKQVVLKNRIAINKTSCLINLSETEAKLALSQIAKSDREQLFDLTKDLLIRLHIVQLDVNKYHILISFHHIILDGWSLGIVLSELFKIYKALSQNADLQLESAKSFVPYIDWIRNQEIQSGLEYWKSYLNNCETSTQVLGMNQQANTDDYRKDELKFIIDDKTTSKIKALCDANQVTLNSCIQTIWGILLQRYNNTNDVVFGAVVSGRHNQIQNMESMVGLFINTIPVRVNAKSDIPFNKLLKEIQNQSNEIEKYQYFSLADIQSQTKVKSDLISHVIAFENYAMDETMSDMLVNGQTTDFAISDFEIFEHTNYDFNLIVLPAEQIEIKIVYNSNAININTIERIKSHFIKVMDEILNNHAIQLKDIDIVGDEERDLLLNQFNDTQLEYPSNKSIQEVFNDISELHGSQIAVVYKNCKLSYKELDQWSNQIAIILNQKKLQKESIIPLIVDRSPEYIVGMLGILKAGLAYLPLSIDLPSERMLELLEDCKAKTILTNQKSRLDLSQYEIINLDFNNLELNNEKMSFDHSTSRDLAYVMYTSGSTGKPKGVMVEHQSVIRLVKNTNYIQFNKNDQILLTGAVSFDATTFEVWGALLNGLTLHLMDENDLLDPIKIESYIQKNNITILWFTASLLTQMVNLNIDIFKGLRILLAGGDVLSVDHINQLIAKYPNLIIINGYGPTENTTFSTTYTIKNTSESTFPIGKPIANSTAYVMDGGYKLTPLGCKGELVLGGDGLARGYLNQPELTSEKFINHPYLKNERIYKTGDIVQISEDGNIEFIGRKDNQIKIRGYRIELGEIDFKLLNIIGIKEATVILNIDETRNKVLVAFLVTSNNISINAIKKELSQNLPYYMIPNRFVFLDKLPLNQNGKVDRKALKKYSFIKNEQKNVILPNNEIEQFICNTWMEILELDSLSITDNFHDLGGNSISAIRIQMQINESYHVTLNDIFKYPTVKNLADFIDKQLDHDLDCYELIIKEYNRIQTKLGDWKINQPLQQDLACNTVLEQLDINAPKNIMITGATGFLGAHLLYELLMNSNANCTCIVRASNNKEALSRIEESWKYYFPEINYTQFHHRIDVIAGDLSKPLIGLDNEVYNNLTLAVDSILNSAANVKHFGRYDEFYNDNVQSVKHLCAFALTGHFKVFHHISTLSVGVVKLKTECPCVFNEQDKYLSSDLEAPYIKSKIEAENYILDQQQKGLNGNIFRVGNLMWNSNSGKFQQNKTSNAFYLCIKSLLKLKHFPDIKDKVIDFSYVNITANSIVRAIMNQKQSNEIYHIFNPDLLSYQDIYDLFSTMFTNLKLIDFFQFIEILKNTKTEVNETLMRHASFIAYPVLLGLKTSNFKTQQKLPVNWDKIKPSQLREFIGR